MNKINLSKRKNNLPIGHADVRPITVILAEEISSIRLKLKSLFGLESDIEVIGEVNNGLDALDLIGTLNPDIIVLGLTASNTLEVVRLINQRYPKTGIIVPYKYGNETHVQELLRYGVKACILKISSDVNLLKAIREWGYNEIHFNESGHREIPGNLVLRNTKYATDPYEVLTPREREVFTFVVKGLTNAAISAHLFISRRTVEIHRHNMLRKFSLHNQQEQLINYAAERSINL